MMVRFFFSVFLLLFVGCSTTTSKVPQVVGGEMSKKQVFSEDDVPNNHEIERGILEHYLALGPSFLLRQVPVLPVFSEDRFVGFEVQAFFPEVESFAEADIKRGDVILAVNQHPIRRPEDLFLVWGLLSSAATLEIDLIREQQIQRRTWRIVDSAP